MSVRVPNSAKNVECFKINNNTLILKEKIAIADPLIFVAGNSVQNENHIFSGFYARYTACLDWCYTIFFTFLSSVMLIQLLRYLCNIVFDTFNIANITFSNTFPIRRFAGVQEPVKRFAQFIVQSLSANRAICQNQT